MYILCNCGLKLNAITYIEALQMYKTFQCLLRESEEDAVPMKGFIPLHYWIKKAAMTLVQVKI